MKIIHCILIFGLTIFAQAQTITPNGKLAEAVSKALELEAAGDLDGAMKALGADFGEISDPVQQRLLDASRERIKREWEAATELDAAMKALAVDRTANLDEVREKLRSGSEIGRNYLRRTVKAGAERDVEESGKILIELGDKYAADLFIERLKSTSEWNPFLIPFLHQVKTQLNGRHLDILIQAADRDSLKDPQIVTLVLDAIENQVHFPPPPDGRPKKKDAVAVPPELGSLAFHLTPDLQGKVASLLVRHLETVPESPLNERIKAITVGSHLPHAIHLLLDKLNQDIPEAQATVYTDLLVQMTGAFDPLMIEKFAGYAQGNRPRQGELAHLLLDVLINASYSTKPPQINRKKVPAEVATLSTRLEEKVQQAVTRALLAVLEHQHTKDVELTTRIDDFLKLSQLRPLPEYLAGELARDTNRPVTDHYITLAANIPHRMGGVIASTQNNLNQAMIRWAESRAKADANEATKTALKTGIDLMVKSEMPNAPATAAAKLLAIPAGPLADWCIAILEQRARYFEPATVNSIASHLAEKDTHRAPLAQVLMQHLEQLAWEPDDHPKRLQAGQTRLERLPARLNRGYHGTVAKALVTISSAYAGKEGLSDPEKAAMTRADVLIVDSRLPAISNYLVDTFCADPKKPEAPHFLDLLGKSTDRLGELDTGRQNNLVNGLVAFVRAKASTAETPETKNLLAKTTKVLSAPALLQRSEQLAGKLHEIPEPAALAWTLKGITTGPGATSQTTIKHLMDQAAKEGPNRTAIGSTLLDTLEKLADVNTPDTLTSRLRPDLQAPVSTTLLNGLFDLNKQVAATTDPKVAQIPKRNAQRIERILVSSMLPGLPGLLLSELTKDPKRVEAETIVGLMGKTDARLPELSTDDRTRLFQQLCAFVDARLTPDLKGPVKAQVDRVGTLLTDARLPGMRNLLAQRLVTSKAGLPADWTAAQLARLTGQLDDATVKTLIGHIGTGGEAQAAAMSLLLRHLEALAGSTTPENLQTLLAADVQTSLITSLRAHIDRQFSLPEKAKGPALDELNRVIRVYHESRLPRAVTYLYEDLVKDPKRPAADNYVGLLSRVPARLIELSDAQQSALCNALVIYLDNRIDPKQVEEVKKAVTLLGDAHLKPALNVVATELHRDPKRAASGALTTVLANNMDGLLDGAATYQSRLADTLIKVIESRTAAKPKEPDTKVIANAIKVLTGARLHQSSERMVGRLASTSAAPSPELTTALINGLKKLANQMDRKSFMDLSNLASREGPNQAKISQLVVYILTRAPAIAQPASEPKAENAP